MPGKHHYFLAKDIRDAIAKHRAEIIFVRVKSNKLCNCNRHNSLPCENRWHLCLDKPWCFYIYIFVSLFLSTDVMKSLFLLFFFKGKIFSLQLNNYLSLFHHFFTIYVYSPTEFGNFTYFLKKSSYYTHFLANVLNNLPDIQILHFEIDVM